MPVVKSTPQTWKKQPPQSLPVVRHDDVEHAPAELLATIAGAVSLNRNTAPTALAWAAVDLLCADRGMGSSGGEVEAAEEEALEKLKTYQPARPTGLVIYLLASTGLRAGVAGSEIRTIVEEVDRLLYTTKKTPAHEAIVAAAVVKAMAPKPIVAPSSGNKSRALLDQLQTAWEAVH